VSSANARSAVVLDAHPLWADAVEGVLRRVGVDVVGKATTGSEALTLIQRMRPDLFVTDVGARDGDRAGLDCLAEARRSVPELRVLVLSLSDDPDEIGATLQAGVSAYVLKSAHPDDLASAVRQAFAHSVYLAPPPRTQDGASGDRRRDTADGAALTKREREILQLAVEGYSNAQLARMLWVTEQTVKFHLSNVYRKLSVSNRTEAARWAQLNGLVASSGETVAA
jgi:DNA-binding NarL/FixJ family response regulator